MRGIFTVGLAGAGALAVAVALPGGPAPAPAAPRAVEGDGPGRGQRVDLPELSALGDLPSGPIYLHFHDPRAPGAEGVLGRLKGLMRASAAGTKFAVVVEDGADAPGMEHVAALSVPVIVDRGGRMARACGVRSRPQAVILDAHGRIQFRGGYGGQGGE